jgi:hydrogenase maturation protease
MNAKLVEDVANAVLYEGYLLYPYRASAVKNRRRWNFGVVCPAAFVESQRGGSDSSTMRIECLARGRAVNVRMRLLHLVTRESLHESGGASDSWQEAAECDVSLQSLDLLALTSHPRLRPFEFAERNDRNDDGALRRRAPIEGWISVQAEQLFDGWFRLRIQIDNTTPFRGEDREKALLQSFVSTHAILQVEDGEFASLLDPPEALADAAAHCRQEGAFPVLAGEPGSRDAMLASPVILYDYPQIAPESPGALFDGTEIDEILSLRILTLTAEEKQQMREVDDFARQILERTESLTPEQFLKMHGVLRQPQHSGGER